MRCCALGFALVFLANGQFNIPIPFGNIGLQKNDQGNLEITSNEGFNIFGYGGKRNLKVVTGNGTFQIMKEDIGLVNGSQFGGSGGFSFDKERGIDIGQNLTLGDHTAVGGPGREGGFLVELLRALQSLTTKMHS